MYVKIFLKNSPSQAKCALARSVCSVMALILDFGTGAGGGLGGNESHMSRAEPWLRELD